MEFKQIQTKYISQDPSALSKVIKKLNQSRFLKAFAQKNINAIETRIKLVKHADKLLSSI